MKKQKKVNKKEIYTKLVSAEDTKNEEIREHLPKSFKVFMTIWREANSDNA